MEPQSTWRLIAAGPIQGNRRFMECHVSHRIDEGFRGNRVVNYVGPTGGTGAVAVNQPREYFIVNTRINALPFSIYFLGFSFTTGFKLIERLLFRQNKSY